MNLFRPPKDFTELTVSKKHLGLRIAAFVLALVVAIGAIGYGVSRIGARDPGWYTIEPTGDDETILYGRALSFRAAFSGSSRVINAEIKELQGVYSAALKRLNRLLDPVESYHGLTNLASLNESPGRELELDETLFAVLTEALAVTERHEGYSLYAGALYAAWDAILYLAEPEDFDPLNSADERERLERLAEALRDPESLRLTVTNAEKHAVRLDVSDGYQALLQELELEGRLLDLNRLHDAFLLRLLAAELEEKGYHNGYLASNSGLTVALSEQSSGEYVLYGLGEKGGESAALAPVTPGSSFCALHAFAMEPEGGAPVYGWYTLTDEDWATVYRHPALPADGEFRGVLLSACVLCDDPVEAAAGALRLFACGSADSVAAAAEDLGCAAAWTLEGEDHAVHVNSFAAAAGLEADGSYGWKTINND